jgi:protein-S-isoprenylcysteine O-methyltransferase Ste14
MILAIMGLFSFLLLGIYDINQVKWNKKPLKSLFFIGLLILIAAILSLLVDSGLLLEARTGQVAMLIISGVFFLLLIYALFIAIPFSKTYITSRENDSPSVCDKGMYALCRHPGFLWFTGAYIFLALGVQSTAAILVVAVFIVCNFLYVLFQDLWTFPHIFQDYEAYKKNVPFLIPTLASINRSFAKTRRKG